MGSLHFISWATLCRGVIVKEAIKATKNVLKRQEYALSNRLLRTAYYPKWKKVYSESKKADVYYPQEIRFYDEVEKANQTLVLIKAVDPNPLPANLFTKAWLESKSR